MRDYFKIGGEHQTPQTLAKAFNMHVQFQQTGVHARRRLELTFSVITGPSEAPRANAGASLF
jgi:hypothetical protein